MFNPGGLYGFCGDLSGGSRVFFHAGVFERDRDTPLPVVGEEVQVEFTPSTTQTDQAPRATRVRRLHNPVLLHGSIMSFNRKNGWGFIQGDDGVTYYLHRSEVEEGRLPLSKQRVEFYPGLKDGKPRACYVNLGKVEVGGPPHGQQP